MKFILSEPLSELFTHGLRTIGKRALITGGLEAAPILAATGLMAMARGRGAIFTLHHVRPKRSRSFNPNAHLEITPEFLDAAILRLKRDGYDFLPLDAMPAHIASQAERPVAAFTLDDGYRNNLDHAAPVFARHGVPFTVFVCAGFAERSHTLWWETLADLLEKQSQLSFDFGQGVETLALVTLAQKQAAFERLAHHIRTGPEDAAVADLNRTAARHGIDAKAITTALTMDAAELRRLCLDPLASLGAHTVGHRALARLPDDEARDELQSSADYIEGVTGIRPLTLAYPYGDRQAVSARDHRLAESLGFAASVTTQPGTLRSDPDLQALPRISLNGHFQKPRYVGALASGIPFRLMGRTGA